MVEKSGICLSTRLNLAFVCFLGTIIVYALRSNVSFAIVCMVNSTALEITNQSIPVSQKESQCIRVTNLNESFYEEKIEGEFAWNKPTQGHIHSAFFWGYMSSQILAGYLASKFGARLVIGFAVLGGAILTLITPIAANTHVGAFIAVRALLGFFQASTFPAMHTMWSVWAPPLERSLLTGVSYAGAQIGNVLIMPMSGLLCKYGPMGGWPSIFYVSGIVALIWCALWFWFVSDTPQKHRRISRNEKQYITESLNKESGKQNDEAPPVPWSKILTSLPIWAIFVGHFAGDWGAYMMATSLPSFMNDVLGFDLTSMGFISSIPYLAYFLMINIGCFVADTVQHKKLLSTLNTRRVAMIAAFGCQAIFLILIGYAKCGQEVLVVVLITLSIGLSGIQYAGFVVNYLDVAPTFAGPILGIGNTISCFAGILAPLTMGWLTPNGTKEEWQTVFYLTGAILIFGAIFFCIFAKGNIQPWAITNGKHGNRGDLSEDLLLTEKEKPKNIAA
uniref:Major facilitator superfamily (MFS) profile domain-containing protein n=1 Tax=Panagrolaimus sp. PS1159 TaxID=55785 RepID=A0AC35G5B8_9BILA